MNNDLRNLRSYFPLYFSTIANRWTAASSQAYLKEFGVGVGEWRVLASIYIRGKVTSNEIVNFVLMDAGSVSRAIQKLDKKGLVRMTEGQADGRTKMLELTEAGHAIYAPLLKSALERQERLVGSLDEQERVELLRLLKKVMGQLDTL